MGRHVTFTAYMYSLTTVIVNPRAYGSTTRSDAAGTPHHPAQPRPPAVLGVDIGTSSSKAVLVDLRGRVLRSAVREHAVDRPGPGRFEMAAEIWWSEFVSLTRELLDGGDNEVVAVGLSGMGPCVLVTDEDDGPLRPAILYGIDTRSVPQQARLDEQLGAEAILDRCGSALTTQAAGPKLAWIAEEEPEVFARARRFYMPSSWLVRRLTGAYVLDHHSASQCTPLYDAGTRDWYDPWVQVIAPQLDLPPLRWSGEMAGVVTEAASTCTGLPAGVPVTTGTIDAWAEAISVGAQGAGDLMLMYGTTMFLIHTVPDRLAHPSLWGTIGALPDTRNLAGGTATSGAVANWLRELFGSPDFSELLHLAELSGVGANGLLLLPYFAGERTPIMDPQARGVLAGLTLSHTRGDLYRAALEATGFAVRHNLEAIAEAGGDVRRVVAVGGGTQGRLWTQIVSDVTGLEQEVRRTRIGASYGGAFLAAQLVADVSINSWNPVEEVVAPRPEATGQYDELYVLYRQLYTASADVVHALAARQHR